MAGIFGSECASTVVLGSVRCAGSKSGSGSLFAGDGRLIDSEAQSAAQTKQCGARPRREGPLVEKASVGWRLPATMYGFEAKRPRGR